MANKSISKQQIKSIYALGASLGLGERGSRHDDALHQLVGAIPAMNPYPHSAATRPSG